MAPYREEAALSGDSLGKEGERRLAQQSIQCAGWMMERQAHCPINIRSRWQYLVKVFNEHEIASSVINLCYQDAFSVG
jgi:hypothetical protein